MTHLSSTNMCADFRSMKTALFLLTVQALIFYIIVLDQHNPTRYSLQYSTQPLQAIPTDVFCANHSYLSKCEAKCRTPAHIDVVFMVKTAVTNKERRKVIRQTWGNESVFVQDEIVIKTVFLLGTGLNRSRRAIDEENRQYNDIVIGDFMDTYYNLTLKSLMGIHWGRTYCPNAKFYVLIDDDTYVFVHKLVRYLRNESNYVDLLKFSHMYTSINEVASEKVRFYGGQLFNHGRPIRTKCKYQVTMTEYPYPEYPSYIGGPLVVMSRCILEDLLRASSETKLFKFEDIYIGLLATKARVQAVNIKGVGGTKFTNITNFTYLAPIISRHYVPAKDMLKIWSLKDQMAGMS